MTAAHLAGSLFLAFYALLVFPLVLSWSALGVVSLPAYVLHAWLSAAFAIELTETLLTLTWRERMLPQAETPVPRRRTAVVMTVCDDWTTRSLVALIPLADAGYRVFLLDDSTHLLPCPAALDDRATIVRRECRTGAKGGNLNNWIRRWGHAFDYLIVLDADSTMPRGTADALVLSAEHPSNQQVAIFQAKTGGAVSHGSLFARALSVVARPRAAVLARVHARLGILLSAGHNQLLRLAPVRKVGGFDESLISEDTILSLQLAARGWQCAMVDAWSSEEEPDTVAEYNRRAVRWARQTMDLCGRDWSDVPLRLKLLLCRHLLSHVLPLVGIAVLALSLWTGPSDPVRVTNFVMAAMSMHAGLELVGTTLWVSLTLTLVLGVARLAVARREGIEWGRLAALSIAASATYPSLIAPLALGLLKSFLGRSAAFIPTRSREAIADESSSTARFRRAFATAPLIVVMIAGALLNPGALLLGFNGIWLALILLAPLNVAALTFVNRWVRSIPAPAPEQGVRP